MEPENTIPDSQRPEPMASDEIQDNRLKETADALKAQIQKVIIGQDKAIDLLISALLVNGHVLIEGVPGIAKTLLAKMLAKTLSTQFTRIQFTPDLMPTDITGTMVFNTKNSDFQFRKGPIFSNIVLIDEINRAPAKTQSALFEVMEESQVTVEGVTHKIGFPFFVLATQNPVEQEGTYKLPEAQLDRFLYRVKIGYPSQDEEEQILMRFKEDFTMRSAAGVQEVISGQKLAELKDSIEKVYIKDDLVKYIAAITNKTRNSTDISLGASPRASLAILKTAKAIAALNGRNFVTPEDIQFVCYPVLNHRIVLNPEREIEGVQPEEIIRQIIQSVEVPR
jgi:MoxR-like ATPase